MSTDHKAVVSFEEWNLAWNVCFVPKLVFPVRPHNPEKNVCPHKVKPLIEGEKLTSRSSGQHERYFLSFLVRAIPDTSQKTCETLWTLYFLFNRWSRTTSIRNGTMRNRRNTEESFTSGLSPGGVSKQTLEQRRKKIFTNNWKVHLFLEQ